MEPEPVVKKTLNRYEMTHLVASVAMMCGTPLTFDACVGIVDAALSGSVNDPMGDCLKISVGTYMANMPTSSYKYPPAR